MTHPLRLQLRGAPTHAKTRTRAKYQLNRHAGSNVLGDRTFDMLGENLGHDHGSRNVSKHMLFFNVCWSRSLVRRGNEPPATKSSEPIPSGTWLAVHRGRQRLAMMCENLRVMECSGRWGECRRSFNGLRRKLQQSVQLGKCVS